jgi:hypothetical protein
MILTAGMNGANAPSNAADLHRPTLICPPPKPIPNANAKTRKREEEN